MADDIAAMRDMAFSPSCWQASQEALATAEAEKVLVPLTISNSRFAQWLQYRGYFSSARRFRLVPAQLAALRASRNVLLGPPENGHAHMLVLADAGRGGRGRRSSAGLSSVVWKYVRQIFEGVSLPETLDQIVVLVFALQQCGSGCRWWATGDCEGIHAGDFRRPARHITREWRSTIDAASAANDAIGRAG